VLDGSGNLGKFVGTVIDETDPKRADQVLRQSEADFRGKNDRLGLPLTVSNQITSKLQLRDLLRASAGNIHARTNWCMQPRPKALPSPLFCRSAASWFTLAANAGLANSRHALKELTQIMTTAQLRDGKARISDWMSHHSNLELAAQRAAVKELDSYAISAIAACSPAAATLRPLPRRRGIVTKRFMLELFTPATEKRLSVVRFS
jgi:hypothetical protein